MCVYVIYMCVHVCAIYMCVVYTCVYVVYTCVWCIHVCGIYIYVCACCSSTQPVPIMWGLKIHTECVPLLFLHGHLSYLGQMSCLMVL